MKTLSYIERARQVMDIEIDGVLAVRDGLGEEFTRLVDLCIGVLDNGGKLVFCGIGKSGHIGRKLTATLASTGSPSAFLYPVEAMHGDLGMLSSGDLLLALSYSGESEELLAVLPAARRLGVPIVAICGNRDSRLAGWSDLVVPMPVPREACPFGLAPTTSTTALLVLGDALAIVLMERRNFQMTDYAKLHPAGAIGRSITLKITDVMRAEFPKIGPETLVHEALVAMTAARSGSVAVVDAAGRLLGIFTDGDFRRRITQEPASLLQRRISEVMTANPITIKASAMAIEVLKIIETRHIDDIIVVDDEGRAVGLVDVQDLPSFKLM